MLGTIHVVAAISALILGAWVIFTAKGTRKHKILGRSYVFALFWVNISALSVYEQSPEGGPFHVFAVISLVTLVGSIIPALTKRPKFAWLYLHAYFISWSYVGLVGAGIGQLGTVALSGPPLFTVWLPILLALVIGGVFVHTFTPKTLASLSRQT